MQVSCKKCGHIEKGLSKSQAFDIARFESICSCPGGVLVVSHDQDPDWLNDVVRDKAMIEELETEDCGPQTW